MSEPVALREGTPVGQGRIGKLLGRGGQGGVWVVRSNKASHLPPRALKACFATDPTGRARFEREVHLLGKCASPFVLKRLDADTEWKTTRFVADAAGVSPEAMKSLWPTWRRLVQRFQRDLNEFLPSFDEVPLADLA